MKKDRKTIRIKKIEKRKSLKEKLEKQGKNFHSKQQNLEKHISHRKISKVDVI